LPDIVKVIRLKNSVWMGHVPHVEIVINAYKILSETLMVIALGRHDCRLKNNIKMYFWK
jgi:hypothetical protein